MEANNNSCALLLASLNKNLNLHKAFLIPGVSVERLLVAWERFVILSDWSRSASAFSIADLILLSLVFASVAHVYPTTTQSPFTSEEYMTNYNVGASVSCLRPLEVFFSGLIVTKLVLDIEEANFYGTSFNAFELELLVGAVNQDPILANIRPKLQLKRFREMKNAIFALHLYVLDLKCPLGKFPIVLEPFSNADDKIEAYLSLVLQHKPTAEDYKLEISFARSLSNLPTLDVHTTKHNDEDEQKKHEDNTPASTTSLS